MMLRTPISIALLLVNIATDIDSSQIYRSWHSRYHINFFKLMTLRFAPDLTMNHFLDFRIQKMHFWKKIYFGGRKTLTRTTKKFCNYLKWIFMSTQSIFLFTKPTEDPTCHKTTSPGRTPCCRNHCLFISRKYFVFRGAG